MHHIVRLATLRQKGYLGTVALLALAVSKAEPGEPFPFVIPSFDSTVTATHVASILDEPRDVRGPVRIVDGHFADRHGERLRLLGVNFSFAANFPDHADADNVAAHLAKLGVNAVRHHHMDARDIWRSLPDGSREVDPQKLEKLAYLIAQLAAHGIYSNINLHVSRSVIAEEGFPEADQLPRYNKYVLYFEPRLKRLLKDYARRLLTYRNPHTGRRLADEPSLVTVEITNENRFALAGLEQLFSLPERYQREFTRRWNEFLKEKYGTTERLKEAWDVEAQPLGEDLVDPNDFARATHAWSLNVRGENRADLKRDITGPAEGTRAIRISIDRASGATHELEFSRDGLSLEADRLYTLSFWIRSAEPRNVSFDVSQAGDPWQPVGIRETLETNDQWRQVVRPFRATKSLDGKARWIFKLGDDDADVSLAAPRLRQGAEIIPLAEDGSLEQATIPVPRFPLLEPLAEDLRSFMEETEKQFFEEMVDYLKEEIGVKAPITGSQVRWQSLAAFEPLDFADAHAYWEHPRFPRRSWDRRDWLIPNTSMIRAAGSDVLTRLAWYRLWGRPYTISEYNHPAPNDYQIECLPLLCIMAALQDWDGVYVYSYQHGADNWQADRIQQFFDINGHPAKLALLPLGAALFRRGDVAAARQRLSVASDGTVTRGDAVEHRVGTDLDSEELVNQVPASDRKRFASDTGQICWQADDPAQARMTVDAPLTKMVLGFIAGQTIELDGMSVDVGEVSRDFGLLAITSLDGEPLARSRHMLLTSLANAANEGMRWNEERTTISDRWGTGPVMVESVPAALRLRRDGAPPEGQWSVYSLDPTGKRRKASTISRAKDEISLRVKSADQTIWYEVICQ